MTQNLQAYEDRKVPAEREPDPYFRRAGAMADGTAAELVNAKLSAETMHWIF